MDYEKKYKNALTIAQSRFKIEKDESVLTCLGMMFPELRESEDERIRKGLIELIENWNYPQELFTTKQNIIAYLEKQKEQEHPCDSAQFEEGFKTGYELGLRKKEEQKPAEWSEEDEYRIRQIERIAQQAGCTQKLQEEIHDWLKSLRSRPKPSDNWKPSDEQREAAPKTCLKGIFDFDDISQLELAANCYKEKKGCAYPVTVEHQHKVLMKLYDLIGVDREALDQDKEDETD